ncbi:MAG: hypothetical protein HYY23_13190 [Verrucomicrobia bacterium]|nr:hypothetical protein [Verrucomicrobiota bacterium]
MKLVNYLMLAAAVAVSFEVRLSAQAIKPSSTSPSLPRNQALLVSPRILEEFPELSRTAPSNLVARRSNRPSGFTANGALTASPRFREEHPELLRVAPSQPEPMKQVAHRSSRITLSRENKAFARSPRFLEEHPLILRVMPTFEIAPLR